MHPAPWVLPHRDARRIGLVTVCLCRRAWARENRDRSDPANAGVGGVNQQRSVSCFTPGGTPPVRSRQASGPARRHFHSPGGSKGTVRCVCFFGDQRHRNGGDLPQVAFAIAQSRQLHGLYCIFGSHGLVPRERTLRVFQCCHSHNHWLNRRFLPFLSKLSLLPAKAFSVLLITRACACRLSRSRQKRPGYPQLPYLAVDNLAYLVDGLEKARHEARFFASGDQRSRCASRRRRSAFSLMKPAASFWS